jgi:hypothetical protein
MDYVASVSPTDLPHLSFRCEPVYPRRLRAHLQKAKTVEGCEALMPFPASIASP